MEPDRRGEVWLVDLGYVAKVRPCLVHSVRLEASDRALVTLVPHTTSTRGSRFEVATSEKSLKRGAFDAQNLMTIPQAKLIRKLGVLPSDSFDAVAASVKLWLEI